MEITDWQPIENLRGVKVQAVAQATISVGAMRPEGRQQFRVTIAKALAEELGWTHPCRVRLSFSPQHRKMMLAPIEEAGRSLGWKGKCATLTFLASGISAAPTKAAVVQHEVTPAGLVLSMPGEAAHPQPVASPPPRQRMVPAVLPPPPLRQKAAAQSITAGRPTEAEDEAEALEMVRHGSNGRQLAEYFGWELQRASAFASTARLQIAAERAA